MEWLRVVLEDDELRRFAEDASHVPSGWNTDAILAYRKMIPILRAAADERDLHAMRSLRLEQFGENQIGVFLIPVSDNLGLIAKFEKGDGRTVIVIERARDYLEERGRS